MAKADPRIFITTCMKNEGPFILEWLAWHRAIGVTDFLIFTNDCTDGTDHLLDYLSVRGHVHHMTNPAVAMGETKFQPIALDHTQREFGLDQFDYVISMDVDEFINVRVGSGQLSDLIRVASPFDVLTMTELNHGSNDIMEFEDCWMTETFLNHQTEAPGNKKARRGVKSLVKVSDKLEILRNHRPVTSPDAEWLDGSGRPNDAMRDSDDRGLDCRGTYDLVVLEHFSLRSLHSYLIKMHRGDVVRDDRQVSRRYWRQRNKDSSATTDMSMGVALARDYFDQHFRPDKRLMEIHDKTVAWHKSTIAELLAEEEYAERKAWILKEAWHGDPVVS